MQLIGQEETTMEIKQTYKSFLPLNLQYFAGEDEEKKDEDGQEEEKLTMTAKELEEKLQKESDRRVTAALKKQEDKMKLEIEQRIEKERKDAEELSRLSTEERAKAEKEREEMRMSEERKKFDDEKRSFYKERLELQTSKDLQERKLPPTFAKFVMGEDAEGTLENIVNFEKNWQEAIELEVNKRLVTSTPKTGQKGGTGYNPFHKDSINLTEQGKLLQTNPEYAKKLAAMAGVKL